MKRETAALLLTALFTAGGGAAQAMTLAEYVDQYNPGAGMYISREIRDAAGRYEIDPLLLASIYYTESRFSSSAVSAAGAVGIAQLMPSTAGDLGVDPYDIHENIDGGARYFRQMLDLQAGRGSDQIDYALSSYNAGPGNVENGIPSYTLGYIRDVEEQYRHMRRIIDSSENARKGPPPGRNASRRDRVIQRLRAALRERKKAFSAETAARDADGREKEKRSEIFF